MQSDIFHAQETLKNWQNVLLPKLELQQKQVKKFAESQGVQVCEKEFHCRGAFAAMHKGRPNADDLEKAKTFVKTVLAGK